MHTPHKGKTCLRGGFVREFLLRTILLVLQVRKYADRRLLIKAKHLVIYQREALLAALHR